MKDFTHGDIETNGINIHYVEQGEGPLIVLCHGWPESWYSWRHQIPVLAEAGYRVVAMSMRGYGQTSIPQDIELYTINHLVGDVVGLVNGLGYDEAIVMGHDWGAPVAWYSALTRPDLFRAVACLSVPFTPPIGGLPDGVNLNDMMRMAAGPEREYYRLWFQEPGPAEADFEADARRSMLGVLYTFSGDVVANGDLDAPPDGHFPIDQTWVESFIIPDKLPSWLTKEDLAFYVAEIETNGIRGGFNWYRNIFRLPGCLAPFVGRTIEQPTFYIGGALDLIANNTPEAIEGMRAALPDLRGLHLIEDAGHWIQQERPEFCNEQLLRFLATLD
jgi:pimeloyl-ACP methyl ester carboxylesterase